MNKEHKPIETLTFTLAALIAFAANSVLCRLALKDAMIDAASFTAIRLLSGILMFLILYRFTVKPNAANQQRTSGSWKSAGLLFIYAASFSFAYISLDTGTGALVLFGAVQLTMIAMQFFAGKRLHLAEWFGVTVSFSGLVYLVYPTLATPSLMGSILMGLSGVAWGIYTLRGRGATDPMWQTALNFYFTLPLVITLGIVSFPMLNVSAYGVMLAVVSGALASALGYTLWYIALRGLSSIEAAVVQLSVPIIAAFGGVLFVAESISLRLVLACLLVLGGIVVVLFGRRSIPSR